MTFDGVRFRNASNYVEPDSVGQQPNIVATRNPRHIPSSCFGYIYEFFFRCFEGLSNMFHWSSQQSQRSLERYEWASITSPEKSDIPAKESISRATFNKSNASCRLFPSQTRRPVPALKISIPSEPVRVAPQVPSDGSVVRGIDANGLIVQGGEQSTGIGSLEKLFNAIPLCNPGYSLSNETRDSYKNRYTNIFPYVNNTLKLKNGDYVNASPIEIEGSRYRYIATQGPLDSTIDDFWTMVWESNSSTIVNLTMPIEGFRPKCALYWPTQDKPNVTLKDGKEIVWIKEERLYERGYGAQNILIRTFEMKDGDATRTIRLFHYQSWPDRDAPEKDVFTKLLSLELNFSGPIVVHCSAGVGRTGTYIGAHAAKDRISQGADQIDLPKLITEMRNQRPMMIQTLPQIKMLAEVIVDFIGEFRLSRV